MGKLSTVLSREGSGVGNQQLDLLPLGTIVFWAYPVAGRRCGVVTGYNKRYSDKILHPTRFPYIIEWDDGEKNVHGNDAITLTEPLDLDGQIRREFIRLGLID